MTNKRDPLYFHPQCRRNKLLFRRRFVYNADMVQVSHNTRWHRWQIHSPEIGVGRAAEIEVCFVTPSPAHRHRNQVQLLVMIEGEMTLHIEGGPPVLVKPNQRFVIPPGRLHHPTVDKADPRVRFVDVRIPLKPATPLSRYAQALIGQPPALGDSAAVQAALHTLRHLPPHPSLSQCAAAIWGLLAVFDQESLEPAAADPEPEDPRLRMAETLLREHLDRELSMTQLAQWVHLSPSHLRQLYVDHFKMPPAQRLKLLRVEQAAHYLSRTTLSVKEIAALCGFSNISHFSRVFKQETGKSPRQYRQMQANHAFTRK